MAGVAQRLEQTLALERVTLGLERGARPVRCRSPRGSHVAHLGPQQSFRDDGAIGEHGHAFHDAGQLADVARPVVSKEHATRAGVQASRQNLVDAAGRLEEVLGEQEDVAAALTKRRQPEGDAGQPVIEVGPEAPVAHGLGQVGVGCGDDPDVDGLGAPGPESPHRPLLDDLEQLALQRRRHEADLVEEERAPVGLLEESAPRLACVGEGAPLVPEELILEQRLGDGARVQVDEGALPPGTGVVHRAGEDGLAGAGLSLDEDGGQAAAFRGILQ